MLDPKIHTLLTLEELGSYTRAAQALSLTQPAVSHHVRMLEEEYGIQMLDLTGYEYEPYFMCDTMHLGWKGWLTVDRALIDYYYGL